MTGRAASVVSAVVLASTVGGAWGPADAFAHQSEGLRIVVLEGEDSVNIIGQGTAVPTLVEVRDRNDLPVSGAAVRSCLSRAEPRPSTPACRRWR